VEIVADHHGDAFRCIYTVRYATSVYVLHVFQNSKEVKDRARDASFGQAFDRTAAARSGSN
jgi:phage-related protein